jgi:UDP-N-acetylmuramyl pentapeptide phosphotransferase/UDP-N-acetylglucosamine-1-phosphate transferase
VLILSVIILVQILLLYNIKKLSNFLGIYDLPDNKRKKHSLPTPLFGGFLILLPITLFIINSEVLEINDGSLRYYFSFLILIILVSILGFLDDKLNINNKKRIILLISIVLGITLLSPSIFVMEKIKFSFYENDINTYYLKMFLFPIGFILLSTILNLIDGENGILLTFFLVLIVIFNNSYLDIINLLMIISILLTLILNLKNKLFMGSLGVHLISLYLAVLILNQNYQKEMLIDEIFIIFILPLVDAAYLFFYRSLNKDSPFKPDENHFHHNIIKKISFINKDNCFLFYNLFALIPYVCLIIFDNILISIMFFITYYLSIRFKNK